MSDMQKMDLRANLTRPLRWAFVGGVLAALYSLSMPNYYRSEARLLPVDSKGSGSLGALAGAAAAFGVSVPGGDSSDANFVDILNSRWLKEQILQTEFEYHVRTWRFGQERLVKGTLYDCLQASNMDKAVGRMGTMLLVSRDIKSKIISINAETTSPELSQLLVRHAGKLLETFLQEKGRTRGSAKAAFAEARLTEARQETAEAENALQDFLERNRNFQTSADPAIRLRGNRLETELRLRQQLVAAIAMNREQALLEEKNDIPILNVLDPGNLPIDKSRPARSQMVMVWGVLSGLAAFCFDKRAWLKRQMFDRPESGIGEKQ